MKKMDISRSRKWRKTPLVDVCETRVHETQERHEYALHNWTFTSFLYGFLWIPSAMFIREVKQRTIGQVFPSSRFHIDEDEIWLGQTKSASSRDHGTLTTQTSTVSPRQGFVGLDQVPSFPIPIFSRDRPIATRPVSHRGLQIHQ